MWGNFFKRKQRDDDEFAFITGYNLSGDSSVVRSQIHDSILTGEQYVSEVLKGHELACKREFRMEKAIFHKLVDLLRERNLLQDTRGVTVEEQVAIFMYAISKNASNRDMQWRFQHSGETISRHFGIVPRAMVRLTTSLIQLPTVNIPFKISSNSKFMPYFKEQGRSNQRPQTPQELFNLRHAQLRNHIERIIGVLKMRFQILKCASQHPIDSQADIVLSCCALHNFISSHEGSEQWIEQSGLCIEEREIVDVPSGDTHYINDVQSLNQRRALGSAKRDKIADDMWRDYNIYLQRTRRNDA